MRNLSDRIRTFIFSKKDTSLFPRYTPLDFIRSKKGILRELNMSMQSGNFVGVYSESLGQGMFLARVESIEPGHREECIRFHQYDISGQKLPKARVSLEEISMVCPFFKEQTLKTPI